MRLTLVIDTVTHCRKSKPVPSGALPIDQTFTRC